MSGVLREYNAVFAEAAGQPGSFGDMRSANSEITIPGTDIQIAESVKVDFASFKVIWEWEDMLDFVWLEFGIVNPLTIELNCAYMVDEPTDAAGGDYTPTGTNRRWRAFNLAPHGTFRLNTDAALIHTSSAANDVDDDGTGKPKILSELAGGNVNVGKVYRVIAWNPSTDTPVYVKRAVIN